MDRLLPDSVSTYLHEVTGKYSAVQEVWLVGSRANGTAREGSDWDFLLFADESTLSSLRSAPELARSDVDILVVVDGDRFESPWPRTDKPGRFKQGRLANYVGAEGIEVISWEWNKLSNIEAEYTGEGLKPQRAYQVFERYRERLTSGCSGRC